jgi:hypothetical protein
MAASRRKQRRAAAKQFDDADHPASGAEKRLPPARPPSKNLPLLLGCITLCAAWLAILVYLAVSGL